MDAPEQEDWQTRLFDFVQMMAARDYIPVEIAAHFGVVLSVARKGLHIPAVVTILRDTIYRLATLTQKPVIKAYMDKVLADFERELLVGEVAVQLLKEITEGE